MVWDTMITKVNKNKLGQATKPPESACALLDPRKKEWSADHLVNGISNLKFSTINDVKSTAGTFAEENIESTISAVKCGDDGVGIVTGGCNGSSNPDQRPSKQQKVLSNQEERRLARFRVQKESH